MAKYPDVQVGDIVTADLLDSMLPDIVVKAADEPVTSNITPQDDNELFLSVEANATYILTMFIPYTCANFTADIRVDFTVPTSATLYRSVYGLVTTVAAGTSGDVDMSFNPTAGTDDTRATSSSGSGISMHVLGTLITSSTAGTLQFRWAQSVSDAAAVTVKAGAWMMLKRVA